MRKANVIAAAGLICASVACADSNSEATNNQHEEGGRLNIYQKHKHHYTKPESIESQNVISSLKTMNDDLRILEERQRIIFVTLESLKR